MSDAAIKDDYLPFVIRFAESEEDIRKAVFVRQSAYARHLPELAQHLFEPEESDYDPGSVILLAESKIDGQPLGSMRIQSNRYSRLALEESVKLPDLYSDTSMVEAVRMGVIGERIGSLVRTLMIKSLYCHCMNTQVDWIMVTARKPVDRLYRIMLMEDVYGVNSYFPMRHVANIPHCVLSLKVSDVRKKGLACRHPQFSLFFETRHPDIEINQDLILNLRNPAQPKTPARVAVNI